MAHTHCDRSSITPSPPHIKAGSHERNQDMSISVINIVVMVDDRDQDRVAVIDTKHPSLWGWTTREECMDELAHNAAWEFDDLWGHLGQTLDEMSFRKAIEHSGITTAEGARFMGHDKDKMVALLDRKTADRTAAREAVACRGCENEEVDVARWTGADGMRGVQVMCMNCRLTGADADTAEEAVRAWNEGRLSEAREAS